MSELLERQVRSVGQLGAPLHWPLLFDTTGDNGVTSGHQ